MQKIFLLIAVAIASVSCHKEGMQAEVYKEGAGYGYKITQNGKILIRQSTIPSAPGGKIFCDSIDAIRVSNEVLKLLHQGKIPAITGDDLSRLNIRLKC